MKVNFLEKILIFWGVFWGILGLGLYFLGLIGLFYKAVVIVYGLICFWVLIYFFYRQKIFSEIKPFFLRIGKNIKKDWIIGLILVGFLVFGALNFLILTAPEVGFDALWYHLTLPKIYLMTHRVSYLSGGLLYYSVMPRLAEMIYGFGLAWDHVGTIPRLIHYLFGFAWAGATYLLARLFLDRRYALLTALTCYGTYLVTWLSATAYIDLIVAFYAAMALWGVFKYLENRLSWYLYLAAIFMGLVLSSKLYGLILLVVLITVLILKISWKITLRFVGIALVIVLPFYLQAYFATGNPFYPVFSVQESALAMYTGGYSNLKDWYMEGWWQNLPVIFWEMIVYRFAPIFGLIFLVFFVEKWQKMLFLFIAFLSFFFLWSLNPVQEPRYFIVILPVLATISIYVLAGIKWKVFKIIALILLLIGFVFNFTNATEKFKETLELVFGKNPRQSYFQARLTPPRNFYDFSGNFGQKIKDGKVLTVNIHNLFYIDFNFWDWSFIENKYESKASAGAMAYDLKRNGYDYVLIGHLNAAEWLEVSQTDADQNFKLILKENDFSLYKIGENQ